MARLKIVREGKVLWEASSCHEPPFTIVFNRDVSGAFGDPDYSLFAKRPLPGVIRGDNTKAALGQTDVGADGLRDRN